MNKAYLIIIFCLSSFSSYSANSVQKEVDSEILLRRACIDDGGKIVESLICPQSKVVRKGLFCKVDERMFYNGCTASVAGYGSIFFEACRVHDHCYHHEPATNGKRKKTCDNELLDNMKKICDGRNDLKACGFFAKSFYKAVKYFGEDSFRCSNTVRDYPEYMLN